VGLGCRKESPPGVQGMLEGPDDVTARAEETGGAAGRVEWPTAERRDRISADEDACKNVQDSVRYR
jgi:hypothetical protein